MQRLDFPVVLKRARNAEAHTELVGIFMEIDSAAERLDSALSAFDAFLADRWVPELLR